MVCIKEETKQPPVYTQPVYAPVCVPNPSTNTAQPILMRQTNANQNQIPTAVNNPSNGSTNAANQCNTRWVPVKGWLDLIKIQSFNKIQNVYKKKIKEILREKLLNTLDLKQFNIRLSQNCISIKCLVFI